MEDSSQAIDAAIEEIADNVAVAVQEKLDKALRKAFS